MKKDTIILYIPGYKSNGSSNTFKQLKSQLSEYEVQCLDYDNVDPTNAEKQLTTQIKYYIQKSNDIILVGSSLGGYWTNFMAQKFKFPCFLINPSLFPNVSLKKYNIDEKYLNKYKESTNKLVSRTIFLGTKDSVVDYKKTLEFFKNKYDVTLLSEGHRLSDYTIVINKIKYYINNVQEI